MLYLPGLDPIVSFTHEFEAGRLAESSARIGTDSLGDYGTADYVNQYSYDALSRLTRVTQGENGEMGPTNAVAAKRVDFTYNKASQLSTITRYAALTATNLVAASTFGYDDRGRLQSLTHTRGGTTLAGYGFGYDEANRLTSFTNSVHTDESATYTYDDRGQLTNVDRTGTAFDELYIYDPNGNRDEVDNAFSAVSVDYETSANNQLYWDSSYLYEYDAEGNREFRQSVDTGDYTRYQWDNRNRLTAVIDYDDNGTPSNFADDVATKRVDYIYDAFDRLIERKVDADGNPGTPADVDKTFFLYDQGQVALEFHKTGSANASATDLSHRYLWNPAAVDQLLADEQITNPAVSGEVVWALTDQLGSVRDVVDDSGVLQNHKSYDSFGNVTSETNAAVDTVFGYTGRFFDDSVKP